MEGLRVVLHGLLVEGAARRIHALVARLHRYLIRAELLLLLMLIIEEASLHRVPVVDDGLNRVVLLVRVHQWVDFVLVRLVLRDLDLVLRRGEVGSVLALLAGLLVGADDHLLLVVVCVLRLYDVGGAFGGALLLGGLLLSAIVRVVYLPVTILLSILVLRGVVLALQVGLVRPHVGGHVMGLQVVLVLHHEHVIVRDQMVGLIRDGVVQLVVEVVVAGVVLLRRLEDVLDLRLKFFLILLVQLVHDLLVLDELLALVFLANRLVDHVSFVEEHIDAFVYIVVFEVGAGSLALVVAATVVVVLGVFALEVAIVEHVDAYEVGHLVVHYFALAKLERQILVVFVFLRCIRVLLYVVKYKLGVMVHYVGANSYETQLFAAIQDVPRHLRLLLLHEHHLIFRRFPLFLWIGRIDIDVPVLDILRHVLIKARR